MLALPDYIVLDFLEWISQNYQSNKLFLESLLNNKELVMSYAKEYLHEQNEDCSYKKCKKILKRYIDQVINSKEFDKFFEQHCEYRCCKKDAYYCAHYCLHRCYHELEDLLYNRFRESREFKKYKMERIEPHVLVDSLYYYIDKNGAIDNPVMLHLMLGCSSEDLSIILDFFNWLKEQNEPFNIYKMPEVVFKDVIQKYELNRKIEISNKSKKDIVKIFSNKSSNQIYEWMNKIFGKGRIRGLHYTLERYYTDKAKYKCILLPLKGESEFRKFVKKYWYDLDAASSNSLDIFYSLKEFDNTGYVSLSKIKDLEVDTNMLPCVVIWQQDISLAKAISVRKLNHSDLCKLLLEIISYINKDMDLEQVYREALKMVENLKDENKIVQKIEQNINGTNYGAVTGINEGMVKNVTIPNNQGIQNDIQNAKIKIEALEEINSQMKEFVYELLEEAGSAMLKEDDNLKNDCVNKFKGFIAGAGKTSATVLGVLGSIASIASFFGIN